MPAGAQILPHEATQESHTRIKRIPRALAKWSERLLAMRFVSFDRDSEGCHDARYAHICCISGQALEKPRKRLLRF